MRPPLRADVLRGEAPCWWGDQPRDPAKRQRLTPQKQVDVGNTPRFLSSASDADMHMQLLPIPNASCFRFARFESLWCQYNHLLPSFTLRGRLQRLLILFQGKWPYNLFLGFQVTRFYQPDSLCNVRTVLRELPSDS